MDPYLEDPTIWSGVHTSFIVAMMGELNRSMPEGYVACIEEYLWIEDTDNAERTLLGKPDVLIPEPAKHRNGQTSGTAVLTQPTTRGMLPKNKKKKHRYLQIITPSNGRVLTAIELLSPSNKRTGEDRAAYLQKRKEFLAVVDFVELDLLRAGHRMPMGQPAPPPTDYYAFICRENEYPRSETWAFSVRDPLPVIPIPLAGTAKDIPLDLRTTLNKMFELSSIERRIDYSIPPRPPLHTADAEWAASFLPKPAKKKKK
jgi:hypothetical protein